MASTNHRLRIAVLNADTSTPNTYANMGTFGDVLHRVLQQAALRANEKLCVTHAVYNVVEAEYPTSLSDFDAVIVTASAASSYDGTKPWIRRLEDYLVELYRHHANIRLFGSCFGHHMICQALLGEHGLRVEKSPRGWEIGVSEVVLTRDFKEAFQEVGRKPSTRGCASYGGRLPSPEDESAEELGCSIIPANLVVPPTVRLQFVHEDQVVLPRSCTSLPPPWILLGSTEHCAVQGVYEPGRVLTLQGHFEFDKFKNEETYRIFGADGSTPTSQNEASHGVREGGKEEIDDGYLVAEMVVRFLSDRGISKASSPDIEDEGGMLPTPRASIELY